MQRIFLAFSLLVFSIQPILADERRDTLHQIEMAKQEVMELEKALSQLKAKQNVSLRQLRAAEKDIADLRSKIAQLKKDQDETVSKLTWLDEEKQKTEQKQQEQEQIFAKQAKATYESGRQEYLKLLLNQQNPEKVSRALVYYDYLSQARLVQLNEFQETVKQLKSIEGEMLHYKQQLELQNTELQAQHVQLMDVKKKRQQILAGINQQIKEKNTRLTQREKDQIELNKVLTTIDATLAKQATDRSVDNKQVAKGNQVVVTRSGYIGNFATAKGKLPWPVSGRVIASYGSARDDNRTKWDGVLISASRGQMIKAVHGGRVVYSDWLRGTGWLTIIDHGQGYYSLYGNNQTLLKKVGDTIKTGDVIATAGSSGDSGQVALYFSIRKQGQTVNPALWCH